MRKVNDDTFILDSNEYDEFETKKKHILNTRAEQQDNIIKQIKQLNKKFDKCDIWAIKEIEKMKEKMSGSKTAMFVRE